MPLVVWVAGAAGGEGVSTGVAELALVDRVDLAGAGVGVVRVDFFRGMARMEAARFVGPEAMTLGRREGSSIRLCNADGGQRQL